jgi:two-component system response regulator AtoC
VPYSVLIVDDEALTLRTLGRALGDEGFEVFLAMSGEEALQIFSDEKPDFALLDVVLPAMNGIEVLRQAKVSSPATIILMMSAYHMVDRAVEAMKLGAYDYLIKPFHVADMVNTRGALQKCSPCECASTIRCKTQRDSTTLDAW